MSRLTCRRAYANAFGTLIESWWWSLGRGAIVMVWRDVTASGNLRIETLGEPPKEIVDADGVLLLKRKLKGDVFVPLFFENVYYQWVSYKGFPRTRGDRPMMRVVCASAS